MHLGHLIVKRPQNMHPTLQLTLTFGIIYGLVLYVRGKTMDSFSSESGTGDPGCHILS